MRFLLLTSFLFALAGGLSAQDFSGGFRAGLNFVAFDGDAETSPDGSTTYETFNNTTGFHVGATFALAFTDLVGVKAELMYSQKGGERVYEAGTPSYFYLYANEDDLTGVPFAANVEAEIDVVNSYIDIPVTGYYRIGIVELEAGASMGFLVNSQVSGGYKYTETIFGDDPVSINIEGATFSDEAGGGGVLSRDETPRGPDLINLPNAVSAYYNNDSNESLYRRLDFALVGGVNVFLNNGLFLGVRYQYGLTDLTKGANDLRIARQNFSDDREYNTDDKDYSRNLMVGVGFRF